MVIDSATCAFSGLRSKMADDTADTEDGYESLQSRHKNENKELHAKIQSMKHSIPKGDKKKKKQVTAEISALEEEQKKRHEKEIQEFQTSAERTLMEGEDHSVESELETKLSDSHISDAAAKTSRAQKRRDKKAAKERDREERIAQAEADNVHSARNVEAENLKKVLSENHLTIKEITPDGNCLYNAVAHQLIKQDRMHDAQTLRKCAADYMLTHRDEFLPFLVHQDAGSPYTEDEFAKYCDEVATTTAWGGHLEIQALSEVLKLPIDIYQADAPVLKVGEKHNSAAIKLSYHRHAYGLGEHYNSVVEAEEATS